jgi:hypothetical protein
MPYDQEFLKLTWNFTIVGTPEIAQVGLNFSDPINPVFDALASLNSIDIDVLGPLLLARMATLLGTSGLNWANYSRLNSVRVAGVLMSGLEIDPAKQFEDSTPAAGSATNIPPQSSLVVSTRSGLTTGSANFGRMYLPHTMPSLVTGTPFVGSGDTAAIVTAAATFVNGVRADINASAGPPDLNAMIMTQVTGGFSKEITQVAVGNVIDTQRRRRNQLNETYAFAPIP